VSVPDDHPIEGRDWKESNISMSEFGNEVLQQMLQKAADAGEVFKSRAIQGMRVLGVPITTMTDRPSSGQSAENNSVQSGATNLETPVANPVTPSQTSRVCITSVTDRPSSGGNVENHSGRSERRIRERPHIGSGTQPDTTRASVSAGVPDADAETRSRESVGNIEDEIAVLAIGLQSGTGEIKEVVTVMEVGSRPSVAQVMDHLKQHEEAGTYDLRQRLEPMSLNSVEIRTAKKPMRMRQVAEFRNKWGDNSEVLGRLDEVRKMRPLVPCLPCQESDDIRRAAGHAVSSSTPIFVVYIFEVQVSGP